MEDIWCYRMHMLSIKRFCITLIKLYAVLKYFAAVLQFDQQFYITFFGENLKPIKKPFGFPYWHAFHSRYTAFTKNRVFFFTKTIAFMLHRNSE